MTVHWFDPREYFMDELRARGLSLKDVPFTVRNWYSSTETLTPEIAWAIGVQLGIDADSWLRLDAEWQARPADFVSDNPYLREGEK